MMLNKYKGATHLSRVSSSERSIGSVECSRVGYMKFVSPTKVNRFIRSTHTIVSVDQERISRRSRRTGRGVRQVSEGLSTSIRLRRSNDL